MCLLLIYKGHLEPKILSLALKVIRGQNATLMISTCLWPPRIRPLLQKLSQFSAAACRQPRKIISFVLIVFAMATLRLYYSIKCCPLAWHCVGVAILTCFKVRKMLGKVVQSWSNAAIPVKVVPFTLHHFGIRQHWALALRTHIPLLLIRYFLHFIDFLGSFEPQFPV